MKRFARLCVLGVILLLCSPSSTHATSDDPPPSDCPIFFTAGSFIIYKCIDLDDDKLLYANSVGFISQCTDY